MQQMGMYPKQTLQPMSWSFQLFQLQWQFSWKSLNICSVKEYLFYYVLCMQSKTISTRQSANKSAPIRRFTNYGCWNLAPIVTDVSAASTSHAGMHCSNRHTPRSITQIKTRASSSVPAWWEVTPQRCRRVTKLVLVCQTGKLLYWVSNWIFFVCFLRSQSLLVEISSHSLASWSLDFHSIIHGNVLTFSSESWSNH